MNHRAKKLNVGILGDGGWGTTLAMLLSRKGFKVSMWGAFPDYVAYLNRKRINTKFLPNIQIPDEIEITHDLKRAVEGKQLIVVAVPSQYLRKVLKKIKRFDYPKDAIYLSVSKGIEVRTLKSTPGVIYDELGRVRLAVLSGPTIAQEVA